jgi:hypothetical protein
MADTSHPLYLYQKLGFCNCFEEPDFEKESVCQAKGQTVVVKGFISPLKLVISGDLSMEKVKNELAPQGLISGKGSLIIIKTQMPIESRAETRKRLVLSSFS